MAKARKLVMIGFDSISLSFLDQFVAHGVMPTVGKLMREGSVTQTWPCFPMETGTNWACLATGASPWVTGCNMQVHMPGTPLDQRTSGFPARVCKAEQLWTTAHRVGKRSVIFDWAQSFPLSFQDGIIHVGEDGRPDNAMRALQEVRAYTTHPRAPGPHVTRIEPHDATDWPGAPAGALEFEVRIEPGPASRYRQVESFVALILRGEAGYDRVSIYASRGARDPLLSVGLNEWSDWVVHPVTADGRRENAGLRAKLLRLSRDAADVHLYLSEIYPTEDFAYPAGLSRELAQQVGPFAIQCSRQQVVQGGASDIATYIDEQRYLANYWRDAASYVLSNYEWDLFMLKWHGPDWTNHLTMYMIDPRHPMHDPSRAARGWALWDELMGWGDQIVARALEAAGPDTLVALVSDHGGGTALPGLGAERGILNEILRQGGWLTHDGSGAVQWDRSQAYGTGHYVYLNVKGREPQGIVNWGDEFLSVRDDIIEALLAARDSSGRHPYRVVLPMDEAGRLAVGGERVGDIFLVPAQPHPLATVDHDAFWRAHSEDETGTWDWPRMNTGDHLDDSYFVLAGPGVRRGYRRRRPTLITSVAPTCAVAWGIPVPADADGSVLWDFLT